MKDRALSPEMWHLEGDIRFYNIDEIENSPENREKIFYKQHYIEGYDEEHDTPFNQTLIVTFSLKYKNYQAKIREQQIERAKKALKNPSGIERKGQNDFKRLIKRTVIQSDDEKIKKKKLFSYSLNQAVINEEAKYDGFYAVSTNLDDDPADIVKINRNRWEIEESFRIMKSEFKARPVFLKRDDRIKAHFMTCFITLLIYRLLENQLNNAYTCQEIISTLRNMNLTKVGDEGFVPAYTRTPLTDGLHAFVGFRTDYKLTTKRNLQSVISKSKKQF
ncbi:MAG: transposase [Clostridiales bacterium]|nr:transposase [Clostridiales bacterium]